jgi:hypothetical protein
MSTPLLTRSRTANGPWCRGTHSPGTLKATFLALALLLIAVTPFHEASGADISVLNGDVNLSISSAIAGQEPSSVMNETRLLQWSTLALDPTKKITAQTNLGSPQFLLTARAVNITAGDGTAVGEVVLTTSPSDFVVDIPAGIPAGDPATCTLRYTASTAASDGTGTDLHTVTYTIIDQ